MQRYAKNVVVKMSTWERDFCVSGSTTVSAHQAGDSPIFVHLDEPNADLVSPSTASKSPKKQCMVTPSV